MYDISLDEDFLRYSRVASNNFPDFDVKTYVPFVLQTLESSRQPTVDMISLEKKRYQNEIKALQKKINDVCGAIYLLGS